ncbi:MAG: DUF6798 domain-containing protein [Planctomycetota bacterium]
MWGTRGKNTSWAGAARQLTEGGLASACALAALCVCQYRFGIADQAQYLVQAVAFRFRGALIGDPYLQAFDATGSLFWYPLATVAPKHWWGLASLLLTLGIAAAGAIVLARLGRSLLFGRRDHSIAAVVCGSAVALVFVIPKEQNYFGLVSLADVELTATLGVLPLVFLCVALFAKGYLVASLLIAVVAVPVHGQTAAYLLATWCVGAAWLWYRDAARLAFVAVLILVGAAIALLVRTQWGVDVGAADDYRRLGGTLYAPLIDPFAVPWTSWGSLLLVVGFGCAAVPGLLRQRDVCDEAMTVRHRLITFGIASLAFPLAGMALIALGARDPMIWRLMPPRSFMLVQIVSLVLAATWCLTAMRCGGRRGVYAAGALVGLAMFPSQVFGLEAAAVLGAVTIMLIVLSQRGEARMMVARPRLAMPAALSIILLAAHGVATSPYAWHASSAPGSWERVQIWARNQTPEDAVFITPPYMAGWRIGSHRRTFGELRDGALLFYAGEPVFAWEDRMALLGMHQLHAWWWDVDPQQRSAREQELREQFDVALRERGGDIVAQSGARYIVTEGQSLPLSMSGTFPRAVWSNGEFTVHELVTLTADATAARR